MTRKRRASTTTTTASSATPSKRRRYPGDIKYVPKKYVSSDVSKFMLKINEKLDLSTVDLRPFRFLRNIQNGVCIYQHLYNMGTDDPVQIVEPTSATYTPAQLVKNDLADRVFATTGGTVDVKYFVDLVKKRSLDDDDMENLCNSLDSCFFVYPFYSEHTIHEEYEHVVEMINDWYKKNDDTPTLIAFVIRNTFNFVIWKAVYDHSRQTTDLFELVVDEELMEDGSTPNITDEDNEEEEEVYEDAQGNRVSKFDAIYCSKCWKRVVKNENGPGYEFEMDEYDRVRYYRWDMAELAQEYYQITYQPSEDQQHQPYMDHDQQQHEYLHQQQAEYQQHQSDEYPDQPEYQVAYEYYYPDAADQQGQFSDEQQQYEQQGQYVEGQHYEEQPQQYMGEGGEHFHYQEGYEQQHLEYVEDDQQEHQQQYVQEQYDENNPEGVVVQYVVAGDATVVVSGQDESVLQSETVYYEQSEVPMENIPAESEQATTSIVESHLGSENIPAVESTTLEEQKEPTEQTSIQAEKSGGEDQPQEKAVESSTAAVEPIETTSTAPSPTTNSSSANTDSNNK